MYIVDLLHAYYTATTIIACIVQWHYDTLHASYTDNYIMAIVQHMHLHVLHKHAFAHIEIHTQSQRTVHGQNNKHIFASQHLAKHVLALCMQLGAKAATSVCKTKTWPGIQLGAKAATSV